MLSLFLAALSLYKGFGFVQFESSNDAQRAAKSENGRFYRGKKLGKAGVATTVHSDICLVCVCVCVCVCPP